jgi:beta-lactam-binding protein with PASTA domain
VSVSAGPGTAAVPPVGGLTRAQAEKALADAGFNHRVRLVYSSSVPAGKVISADPEAGRQLQKGRTVLLTVSRGIQGVPVPKVVGLQRAEAERQLQAAGLTANVTEQETTQPAGTVMKQDPPSGTTVEKGSAVKLTVAKQRPEVPDVSTQNPTVEEATKTLEDAGFKVQTRDRAGDPALAGKVVGQSPPAGTRRSTGATVVLFVVPTATPTPTPTPTATPTP